MDSKSFKYAHYFSNLILYKREKQHKFEISKEELYKGTIVEFEHSDHVFIAKKIALDHLLESPYYYRELYKLEEENGFYYNTKTHPRKKEIWEHINDEDKWIKDINKDIKYLLKRLYYNKKIKIDDDNNIKYIKLFASYFEEFWQHINYDEYTYFSEDKREQGIKVELEHTTYRHIAFKIAEDHLWKWPTYYDDLKKMEKKF
jgi:hypothetical protein